MSNVTMKKNTTDGQAKNEVGGSQERANTVGEAVIRIIECLGGPNEMFWCGYENAARGGDYVTAIHLACHLVEGVSLKSLRAIATGRAGLRAVTRSFGSTSLHTAQSPLERKRRACCSEGYTGSCATVRVRGPR